MEPPTPAPPAPRHRGEPPTGPGNTGDRTPGSRRRPRPGYPVTRPLTLVIALLVAATGLVATPGDANAARLMSLTEHTPRESMLAVYSPSMGKVIHNRVLHMPGTPSAPTFYMLPGLGGAEDGISWYDNTDIPGFFAHKRVNVVMPIGGRGSLFTDWDHDDPVLGRNKWQTYLTRELPPIVDGALRTTRVNAISGVSMSGGPALDLAIQAPHLYRAVASYSGCPGTTGPLGGAPDPTSQAEVLELAIRACHEPSNPSCVAGAPLGQHRGRTSDVLAASRRPATLGCDGGWRVLHHFDGCGVVLHGLIVAFHELVR